MRRKDREVRDIRTIHDIFKKAEIIHLGFIDEEGAYILPLNYGFDFLDNNKILLYFHGANEGKKKGLISKQPKCSFQLETDREVYGDDDACEYASAFKSIMGHGNISFVMDEEERIHGLDMIMDHYRPGQKFTYREEMKKAVTVFKLEITDLSCKIHK